MVNLDISQQKFLMMEYWLQICNFYCSLEKLNPVPTIFLLQPKTDGVPLHEIIHVETWIEQYSHYLQ